MTESLHCLSETITTLLIGYACSVAQSCLTLCDTMDCSPPCSCVHGFPRQEYWSGLPLSSPGNIPDSETQPASTYILCFQVDLLSLSLQGSPISSTPKQKKFKVKKKSHRQQLRIASQRLKDMIQKAR